MCARTDLDYFRFQIAILAGFGFGFGFGFGQSLNLGECRHQLCQGQRVVAVQILVDVLHIIRQLDLSQLEAEPSHLGAVLVARLIGIEEGDDITVSQLTPQPLQLGL
ncbi:hypothetical protein D3C75_446680 [compost metagenome]